MSDVELNGEVVETRDDIDEMILNEYIRRNWSHIEKREKTNFPIEANKPKVDAFSKKNNKGRRKSMFSSVVNDMVPQDIWIEATKVINKKKKGNSKLNVFDNLQDWSANGALCDKGHPLKYCKPHTAEEGIAHVCRHCGLGELNNQYLGYYDCRNRECNSNHMHENCN